MRHPKEDNDVCWYLHPEIAKWDTPRKTKKSVGISIVKRLSHGSMEPRQQKGLRNFARNILAADYIACFIWIWLPKESLLNWRRFWICG
jgi:hypothetical protein